MSVYMFCNRFEVFQGVLEDLDCLFLKLISSKELCFHNWSSLLLERNDSCTLRSLTEAERPKSMPIDAKIPTMITGNIKSSYRDMVDDISSMESSDRVIPPASGLGHIISPARYRSHFHNFKDETFCKEKSVYHWDLIPLYCDLLLGYAC